MVKQCPVCGGLDQVDIVPPSYNCSRNRNAYTSIHCYKCRDCGREYTVKTVTRTTITITEEARDV